MNQMLLDKRTAPESLLETILMGTFLENYYDNLCE